MITFAGRLQLGAIFPMLAELRASLLLIATQGLAQADIDLPEIEVNIDLLTADLAGIQASIQGVMETIALGPAGAVSGAIQAIASGDMLLGLTMTGPDLIASLTASLGELIAKAASIGVRLGGFTAKAGAIKASLPSLDVAKALALSLADLLIKGGARLYIYTGPLADLGAELGAHINGGGSDGMSVSANVWVPIIVTDDPGTEAALQQIIGA